LLIFSVFFNFMIGFTVVSITLASIIALVLRLFHGLQVVH
jgi:hypothetical protein